VRQHSLSGKHCIYHSYPSIAVEESAFFASLVSWYAFGEIPFHYRFLIEVCWAFGRIYQ
jgi:hypothetical protein